MAKFERAKPGQDDPLALRYLFDDGVECGVDDLGRNSLRHPRLCRDVADEIALVHRILPNKSETQTAKERTAPEMSGGGRP